MGLFLKKQKVFISHKRIDGGVSAEAVLLKHVLDKEHVLENFMDVQQETLGLFPATLNDEIRKSNSFIFLIPFDGDVSFLNNQDEWAYQEIRDALFKYKIMPVRSGQKSFQILPVTFSKSFEWADDLPQEISNITQFDICQINLNSKTEMIQRKIGKALHKAHRSINWWGVAIAFFFVSISSILGFRHIVKTHDDRMIEERATYIKSQVLDIIDSKIQPLYIIPTNECIPLEDSIYRFFELRDQLYYIIQTLPVIQNTSIERNDKFTANVIKMVYNAYTSVFIPIDEMRPYSDEIIHFGNTIYSSKKNSRYSSLYIRLKESDYSNISSQAKDVINIDKDHDISMGFLREQCKFKFDEILKDVNSSIHQRNIRKSFKVAMQFTHNYEFWEFIHREMEKIEETAQLCNMILGHQ